jgi:hypothetical protein
MSRLRDGSVKVTRSSLRLAYSGLIALETGAQLRRLAQGGDDVDLADAVADLAWLAENVLAVHGVDVTAAAPLPPPPLVVLADQRDYWDALALFSVAPGLMVGPPSLLRLRLMRRALHGLGLLVDAYRQPWCAAAAVRRAQEYGLAVLCFWEHAVAEQEAVRLGLPVVRIRLESELEPQPDYLRAVARPACRLRIAPLASQAPGRQRAA